MLTKKQKYNDGAFVRIELSANRYVIGRLFPKFNIGIYQNEYNNAYAVPSIEKIIKSNILFYVSIYEEIITTGKFKIIDFREFDPSEITRIPPKFKQSLGNYMDCVIFCNDGRKYSSQPQECIGLERSAVWDEESLIIRIEDYYSGKKNFHSEYQKVILSPEDPRYLNPKVRWDFNAEKFYAN